ncbi:hypothetical protein [Bythopirellula goksoeyrii]|uniref:Uncharacterized protein n=1 Tax=Bythopirellula goksoeyrii TaxID=1400387 RepID=A0A5B9Q4M9_9BACT|nr:hypothetical protein [Bythopirellula goksoeyrii]QEG33927.1 hypothetical protein Pr1d_11980 [Bythopirellula goksoeyrii]
MCTYFAISTILLLGFFNSCLAEQFILNGNKRPDWLSSEGLVMAGSWEPLPFRVRRDASSGYFPTDEQKSFWELGQSLEMIQWLKALGVNSIIMHCCNGGELELEADLMTDTTLFAEQCHQEGIHADAYSFGGVMLPKSLLKENPGAKEVIMLTQARTP